MQRYNIFTMNKGENRQRPRRKKRNLIIAFTVLITEAFGLTILLGHTEKSILKLRQKEVSALSSVYADQIERNVEKAANAAEILSYSIISSNGDTAFFREEAQSLYHTSSAIRCLQIAPGGTVDQIYPEEGSPEGKLNLFKDPDQKDMADLAKDYHTLILQGPFELKPGVSIMAVCNPVYLQDGSFWGFTIVIMDAPPLTAETERQLISSGYAFRIEKTDPLDSTEFIRMSSHGDTDDAVSSYFRFGSCTWRISIEPENGWETSNVFEIMSFAGWVVIVLVAVLVYSLMENKDRQKEIAIAARTDYLTGLNNRKGFDEDCNACFVRHPDEPFTGVMIDIDDFKRVNDLYGHAAGDTVLQALADKMKHLLPPEAIVGRYGGDEFCVILRNTSLTDAEKKLRPLMREALAFETEQGSCKATISAGYASWPEQTSDRMRILLLADDALYAGKLSGKNICKAYQDYMHELNRCESVLKFSDLVSDLPLPSCVCCYDVSLKVLSISRDLENEAAGFSSLKDFLPEAACQRLLKGEMTDGERAEIKMKDGRQRRCRIYYRISRNEIYGKAAVLFFAEDD